MVIVFYTWTHYNIIMHQFWEECGHIVSPVSRFTHYIIPENTWRLVQFQQLLFPITGNIVVAVIAASSDRLFPVQNTMLERDHDLIKFT